MDALEELKKQHMGNYKKAVMENIRNNTNVLIDEDIMSLLKKPPLDSMDIIKMKFLDLAKKNKVVLDTLALDKILDEYRKDVIECCVEVKETRISTLSSIVDEASLTSEKDIIKLNKKDFISLNKKIKKILKDQIKDSVANKIVNNVNKIFTKNILDEQRESICNDVIKFVNGAYQRQLLENVDFKVLVKDTTLINGVKEQAERYLFTLQNSRIFKQNID